MGSKDTDGKCRRNVAETHHVLLSHIAVVEKNINRMCSCNEFNINQSAISAIKKLGYFHIQ